MTDRTDELPKHNDLFWPVVDDLRQLDGAADNDQLVEKVSEILGLGDELTAIPHKAGPQTEIGYRVAWVKSWLKWGAMVDNPQRGVWVLTELGQRATQAEIKDLPRRRRAEAGNAKHVAVPLQTESDFDTPPVSEELDTFDQDEWQNEVLEIIKNLEPSAFERLARRLLLSLGFSNVEVVGRTGDGGIDLLGVVKSPTRNSFRHSNTLRVAGL
jgi:restriction system protein